MSEDRAIKDQAGVQEDADGATEASPVAKPVTRMGSIQGGLLGAAMMGLGEVIEPHKAKPDIEITAESNAPGPGPLDDFEFGELPPLD